MRMMGAESVAYHRDTVLGRGDDHPGQALDYYASRGETPLRWGGAGAARLDLDGAVGEEDYDLIFGEGGARHPHSAQRLVAARRPGLELVVAAHKSVAVLGLVGRAEDMHAILHTETAATMAYLDAWTMERGGRRGRAQTRTGTHGLCFAVTRHATSRAGDPEPHDHVLIANIVAMADAKGGWKGVDTAALRDVLHAATAAGRVAAAAKAVSLGYAIEADDGPSGRLGHWAIAGVPDAVCALFSKRSAEITAEVESRGFATYQARQTAARDTRKAKRHTPPGDLMAGWHDQLASVGHTPDSLLAEIAEAAQTRRRVPPRLSERELSALVGHTLGPAGRLAEIKVFTRADATVAVAPHLFGRHPGELARVVEAVCADPDAIALLGVAAVRERAYTPACVLAAESAIAARMALGAGRQVAPAAPADVVAAAIAAKEGALGRALTAGQRQMIEGVCASGRGAELVLGVAGAGKTTALDVARAAFETAGFRVLGTSTSGQAARTLGREAGITESSTTASLLWRLERGHLHLDARTVVVLDEAGMVDDPTVLRLLAAVEAAKSKMILVGDHRQLGAVGPGGTLEAVIARHPDSVHVLDHNVRQTDSHERDALAALRAGNVATAVEWYSTNGRIRPAADRDQALDQTVTAWAADVAEGHDTAMYAWRRANVAALNTRARAAMAAAGRLTGPELNVDGQTFQAGDRIVTLTPGTGTVTSERGVVETVDPAGRALVAHMDDGRHHTFTGDELASARLAHGYATTVHRAQGATVDTTHLFADGGGRELAYVAMSRARHASCVHTVADNNDQAVEDLARDWGSERRQQWAIDTGTPAVDSETGGAHPLELELDAATPTRLKTVLGRARLAAERDAIAANLKAAAGAEGVENLDPETVERVRHMDRHLQALDRRLHPPRPATDPNQHHHQHPAPPPPAPGIAPGI